MVKSNTCGFSLIEIVLAVGIVTFALVAIFGLFSTSMRSNVETLSQHEVLGVPNALKDFLEAPNRGAGFTNTFDWIKNPSSSPEIYAFADEDGVFVSGLESDSVFSTKLNQRLGRLFRLKVEFSPNMPIRDSSGVLISRPSVSDLPGSAAEYTRNAALAVHVRAYSVPAPGTDVSKLQPIFAYDTTIRR